jgi:ABC-type transport system substrate-binding protein
MNKSITRIFYHSCLILLFFSCKNSDNSLSNGENGFKGGNKVVRIAEVVPVKSMFPHQVINYVEGVVVGQMHEGLLKMNPKDMTLMPGIAEKWEVSTDGKTVVFTLRKDAKFHANNGIEAKSITSKDVKFTFELLCREGNNNVHFETVCKDRIVGANDFRDKKAKSISGFKIIDDYKFSIELVNNASIFLEILTNPVASIISESAYSTQKDKLVIGAGPFVYDTKASTEKHFVFYKNINYYAKEKDGSQLPYIDSVIVDILGNTEEALIKFKEGKYDHIGSVPSNQLKEIVEANISEFKGNPPKFTIDQRPEMITSYYTLNINKAPLNNIKVRQALNYAIDKNRIIDKVLFGQAYGPAIYGLVPPSFSYYKNAEVTGYDLDLEKAKKLLADAGYPNGKNFPELQLIVNGGNTRNNNVAAEIQKQLKAGLNINVTFESMNSAEKYKLQLEGNGDMFVDGWVADYPSPESFLSVFYGGNLKQGEPHRYPNTMAYVNAEYNKNYEMGRNASSRDSAASYFLKADQLLMNDAVIIPLIYESNCRLVSNKLKNYYSSPLRTFDFTRVKVD